MIRFIDISNQIIDKEFNFAWYDTVQDRFVDIGDSQVWDSWKDFKEAYEIFGHSNFTYDRFYSLFPFHHIEKGLKINE